jgi:ferredoxin
MIVGERKPLDEIFDAVKDHKKLLLVGCGGCTSICYAGGQKEVYALCDYLHTRFSDNGHDITINDYTIERQCNADFFSNLDSMIPGYDGVLSLACGAGVQFVAERHPKVPVYPALNTVFVGVDRDVGWFEENCRTCGDCVLGETGGICPVTRCAKSLFNGPCGGTMTGGKCEISKDIPCAWYEIHKRLSEQKRIEMITKVRPARNWENQTQRSLVQEEFKARYTK